MTELFEQVARARGLGEAYYDYRGELKYFSTESRRAVLRAMGVDVDSEAALRDALTQSAALAPTSAVHATPCYRPEFLAREKCWGLSVQLYTLRSARNWGIGDFADLRELVQLTAPLGCDLVGLNPVHAGFLADPERCSPYSPSSRLFLNPLYIAIPDIPESALCASLQSWLAQTDIREELARLRAAPCVEYERVAALKLHALRLLHESWRRSADAVRFVDYREFVDQGGDALRMHAAFDALDAHFHAQPAQHSGWRAWPSDFHDPHASAVRAFVESHAADIDFYCYMQWLAATQLRDIQRMARAHGMRIGLYGDLAVGASPDGSEVWGNQALYVMQASIGAPPDPLALNGQDWGAPPMEPKTLAAQAFAPFAQLMRANMQNVGALRIDHVMSLFRLWWAPRGFSAAQGVYVHYPLAQLCGLLAQESRRTHCLIVGEDLGTVPDEVRRAMASHGLYHYTVLLFERYDHGGFKAPDDYVAESAAIATTHDLPPLKAWWSGEDIALRARLALYPDAETARRVSEERAQDRVALVCALRAAGLWHWQELEPLPEFSFALTRAVQIFLGRSRAAIMLMQLEDLIGMTDPVNVPGTHREHANWRRKLESETQVIFQDANVRELCIALRAARAA